MALSTAMGAGVRVANAMLFAAAMTFAIGLLVEGWQTGPSRWDPTDLAQNALGIVIGLIAFWWFVSPLLPESLGYAGMVSGLLVSVLGMPALIHVAHALFGGGVAKSVCEVITFTRHRP